MSFLEGFDDLPVEAQLFMLLLEGIADKVVELHSAFLNFPDANNLKAMLDTYVMLHKEVTDLAHSQGDKNQRTINDVTAMFVHEAFIRNSVKINDPSNPNDPTPPNWN